jgi:glycosyltransferase involved in cell wall biosynthesis
MQASSESFPANCAGADLPTFSIVVIGRNEGHRLARCLESIQQIRGVTVKEVIYVDSDSTDGSPDLAYRYGATVIVLHPDRPTAAIGRNAGWRGAASDLVLFLDGDTVLHPDFPLAACDALSRDASVAVVSGQRREIHPEQSVYNRVSDLDWISPPGFAEFCGGDALMRRKALLETGGFDEGLIAGEEPDLCRRMRALGYRILHIDQQMTGHDLQITRWSQYWKRATRAGHAYAEVSERYRDSDDPLWNSARKGNLIKGGFWIVSFTAAVAACVPFGFLPIALWFALLLLLSLRSARKARWKTGNKLTLFLYGIHSHLQQIPICAGQLKYALDKRRSTRSRLIEYKAN